MRRVFVTGAGHGIGRAIVEAFVANGDRVAFCDIDNVRGEAVAVATGARFFSLDVCDKVALEGAVQMLLDEWGDLDIIVNRWYYEYTRDLDRILNNRQMRQWRNRYGRRFGDYHRPRTSVSINIGAGPHVHIGGHKNPHKDPHTKPHVAPHKDPHTKPHVAPHTAPHNHKGNVGGNNNRPSNNKGNVGNDNNRPSNNKGSYRSSGSSNKDNATRNGGSTRSSNNSKSSNDKGTSSRGR